jgi:hypothetical protein
VENNNVMYTEEQLMARLKFFIGICLACTLTGIVFVVLYSIIFVTQPLNAISPIDQKFFELIIPIATFLTGTLSGIMLAGNDKDLRGKAIDAATKPTPVSPAPKSDAGSSFSSSVPSTTGFSAPAANPFGSSFDTTPAPAAGFGGKLAPPPASQPLI